MLNKNENQRNVSSSKLNFIVTMLFVAVAALLVDRKNFTFSTCLCDEGQEETPSFNHCPNIV